MAWPVLPPLACDSHMHVFDARFAFAPQARLRPPPATVQPFERGTRTPTDGGGGSAFRAVQGSVTRP